MKKKKKKNIDYTPLLHIIIVILIIVIAVAIFCIAGQNNVNKMVKNTENMYKEKIEDTQKITADNVLNKQKPIPGFERYSFKYIYTMNVQGEVKNLTFKLPVPSDEYEKQYIYSFKLSPTPTRTYHDGVNNIAEYTLPRVSSGKYNITVEGIANLRTYDLLTAKKLNKNISKDKDVSRYLKSSFLIESDDAAIKRIAKSIKGDTQEEIVKNIYEYTQRTIKYKPIPKDIGAKEALKIKQGKCSEFSAVMIALCRARNIPARLVCGNIARASQQKHSWVEVYFDKYGWVAYDPTTEGTLVNIYKDGKLVKQEVRINSNKADFKYIASNRNDFSPWFISYSTAGNTNGTISVNENIQIIKN